MVGLLVPVDPHVGQQVGVAREGRVADLAGERLFPRVGPQVLHQLDAVEEVLVALGTFVLLWEWVVGWSVGAKVRTGR